MWEDNVNTIGDDVNDVLLLMMMMVMEKVMIMENRDDRTDDYGILYC